MKNTRLIIIEDELHNSRMLTGMVNKLRPEWEIDAVLESVEESVEWLTNNAHPDLILMDIQLSDGISFSILNKVELSSKTQIIFTTAYDQYAIRAFKVNSVDYLLKPIKEEELALAFEKFESRFEGEGEFSRLVSQEKDHYKQLVESILSGKKEYRKRFLICGIKDYTKLETCDVAYFYSSQKTTFAVGFDSNEHILDYTLEQLENELDPKIFYRANRQMIVNVDAVLKVSNATGNKLIVKTKPAPDFEIVVSRLKALEFKKWLGK
ncbi:MAG: LytTR family DNA-binding domain-containing protein [Bacteroidales bacterium]|jgi:DNA-binding LytR/AlgR family response regulator|nr:LytTR family DNA-binding domain-containing protein [Bacteroidales bacterium]